MTHDSCRTGAACLAYMIPTPSLCCRPSTGGWQNCSTDDAPPPPPPGPLPTPTHHPHSHAPRCCPAAPSCPARALHYCPLPPRCCPAQRLPWHRALLRPRCRLLPRPAPAADMPCRRCPALLPPCCCALLLPCCCALLLPCPPLPPFPGGTPRSPVHASSPLHLLSCTLPLSSPAPLPSFDARSAALAAPLTLPCQALPPVPCRCVPPACRRPA